MSGPEPGAGTVALAREVAGTGEPRFELVREPDGVVAFAAAAPVRRNGRNGEAGGALLIVGPARETVFDILLRPFRSATGEVVLARRDGDSVLFLSPLRFRPDSPLTFRSVLNAPGFAARRALEGDEAFGSFVDYRGVRVLAAGRKLKRAPWALVAKVDEEEALAPFRKDVQQKGITCGALLLAACAAAVGSGYSVVTTNKARLARIEARFGALVEEADDTIFLLDSGGRILDANRRAEDMYGAERATLLRWTVADLRAPEGREGAAAAVEKVIHDGRNDVTTVHRRADGSTFPVEIRSRRIEHGADALAIAIVRDITERKAAEGRVRALNRLLQTMSEVNQLLVRATDEEALLKDVCRILVAHGDYPLAWIGRADPGTRRVLPVASAGEAGYLEGVEVRWDDTPEGRGPTGTAIREGRPAIVSNIRTDPMAGPWRDRMLRHGFRSDAALPIRRGGAVTACLTVYAASEAFIDEEQFGLLQELARDISFALDLIDGRRKAREGEAELEKTRRQFLQAQKMEAVGRLAGGVAHDFNNLLTVIQGYGEMLAGAAEGDPEKRESVGEIVKAAERASALTRQLLAFSRQQVLEMRVLDVGEVVADIEKMLKRLIGEDIEIVVVNPAALGRVKADLGQIEQVVLNIAVNARDAMPDGGRLTLALADVRLDAPVTAFPDVIPAGRYIVLSLTDTGCGMDAETLSHAFEPFFSTKERGKGTGLGLATVYGIVGQSGGYVAAESAPGQGATFRIYMPRCDDPASSGSRSAVRPLHGGSETVLLVEDEPAVRALAQKILQRKGYTVLVAENGTDALGVLAGDARPVHVLLTDLVMPGMSGRDLASRVAALRPSIRVLFMSGYSPDFATDASAIGASGFLSKPFDERSLAAKIREALDAPRASTPSCPRPRG